MKKTFYFGKVAHMSARKINLIEITLETRDSRHWCGSVAICGGFWNATKTDYVECGQCLDSIKRYKHRFTKEKQALFDLLFGLWERCHLRTWEDITDEDKARINELMSE